MALQVRSSANLGGGSLVRVRSVDGELSEFAFVVGTARAGGRGAINLPNRQYLRLLTPLTLPFRAVDCWVESAVAVPVNLNTADPEVLAALIAHLRRRPGVRSGGDHAPTRAAPPFFSPRRAREIASELVALRSFGEQDVGGLGDLEVEVERRPFDGWEDFARRYVIPMAAGAQGLQERRLWMLLYESLRIGRSGSSDMGTAPVSFHSSPLVGYRASASRDHLSGVEAARLERTGVAIANPGQALLWGAATQEQVEEFTRLDRRMPYWLTFPINTSAILPADSGTVPALRTPAHLLGPLFPEAGFGEPRFPDREGSELAIRAQPASTPFRYPNNAARHESFMMSRHPEGRDIKQEGSYEVINSGPRGAAGSGVQPAVSDFDHSQIRFPLTTTAGLTSRHATRFWFRLESLEPQALYDLASLEDVAERNRISLQIRDGKLIFEVFDEAGLDPEPSQSRSAVERSVGTWELALEEYAVEPQTWYHVSLSALGQTLSIGLTTLNAQSVDVYVDDRPATTSTAISDGTSTIDIPRPGSGARLRIEGFDGGRLVAARKIRLP